MIGLDTNVLARYYVEDKQDSEAERQRSAARRLIESGQPLMVCKTVILELEWVMRGYYGFTPAEVFRVLRHLVALPHVTVEDRVDGTMRITHNGRPLNYHAIPARPERVAEPPKAQVPRRPVKPTSAHPWRKRLLSEGTKHAAAAIT